MTSPVIRPGRPTDLVATYCLRSALQDFEKALSDGPFADPDPTAIPTLVACIDDVLIGYLDGDISGPARIDQLYVCEEWREGGVGASLVDTFLKVAKFAGMRKCSVYALTVNSKARTFYHKQGFRYIQKRAKGELAEYSKGL